jgi:Fe-S-cluster containining protein
MPDRFPDAGPDLFDRATAQLGARLKRAREPRQMMTALRWAATELDRTYATTPPDVLATVACRSGCAACCHVPVDVQAHEVFLAADHIQTHFSPDALAALILKLAAHRAGIAALGKGARDASRQPCALLVADACSIYADRPQPCRSHHANDAAVCTAHRTDPTVDVTKVYIPALRARMFAVMLGVDEAFEAVGYDDRAYDFGSALHEALTNCLPLVQWMRRQVAFPDSCLADPMD